MPKDFLLEIGTEPLPARFAAPALEQLLKKAEALFSRNRLEYQGARGLATPRRLAVLFSGLAENSQPLVEKVYGPPSRLLKDEKGGYTVQAAGFADKHGVKPQDLAVESTGKGDYLVATRTVPGEPAVKILSRVLPELIASLEFPKSLEWEESRFRFGRPIRSLTALYGKTVVPFSIAGVKSGRYVRGLSALGRKPVSLPEAGGYQAALKNLLVLADAEERRQELKRRLESAAKRTGGRLDLDPDLLEETLWMTEHPVPVPGEFRKEFLGLPAPLLSVVLKKQLKFFPILGEGGLLPEFIGVRDGISEGQKLVQEGFERVLEARFDDAAFFFSRDRAARLEAKLPLLERVGYQKGLGTMAQKAGRLSRLSERLCEALRQEAAIDEGAVKAIARLAYADLVCEVVKEFPELQGAMGGIYARLDGLDERVALGLEQFYFPVASKAPVPLTLEGALVSLAGKIDSLAGSFAVGVVPTGSADPFGLRRQGLGVIRILLEKQLPLDLDQALEQALSFQPVDLDAAKKAEIAKQLGDFIWARAQSLFEEMGYKADEIRAVRAEALRNLSRTLRRLAAVHAVRRHPDFEPLAAAFKRASNILRQANVAAEDGAAPERGLLREAEELSLYDTLAALEGQVREKIYQGGFEAGLRALVAIKPHLDLFFERVMVMAEEPELRRQRLGLLARLVRLFNSVADLSEIQAAG